jgi:hypothetical protein
VKDVWAACCEIYLQAQLIRQAHLHSFSLDGVRLFDISYVDDALVCQWSVEHVFVVEKEDFATSCETLVQQVLAETSDPRRADFVQLGASLITTRPQFSALLEPS